MRDNTDFIKVLDFGLAKLTREDSSVSTLDGSVLGTPRYMAPEALVGAETDPRSDVYALGCVFYEMLTGRPAFEERTALAMLNRNHESTPPRPISELVKHPLSDRFQALITHCLQTLPASRYSDAGELGAALAAITSPQLRGAASRCLSATDATP